MKDFIQKKCLLIYSFLIAAVILLFCSKSSPLYPMNDWVDVHCFLTLGKGLLHGLVPYVDLYEQKGPLLYFIYAYVALFSQKSMLGQYLLEITTFGLFLYFSAKLAEIYLGRSKLIYPSIAVLAAVVATTRSFQHGGSVEQMCLFLFVYGLYSVTKACHEQRPLTFREALTNGIFAGAALWIKYTMLGFYLGLCLFVLIWYIGWVRDWKKLLSVIGVFLLGIASVTIIVLTYFFLAGGINAMFTCYFYNNIFLYPSESDIPKLTQIWNSFSYAMEYNKIFPIFLYIGLGWLILRVHKIGRDLLAAALTFTGLVIGTYMGQGYVYYGLVLSAFTVYGLIAVAWILQKLKTETFFTKFIDKDPAINKILIATFVILCALWSFNNSDNTYLIQYEKDDLPQYQFANIIKETEDATLLNFGFLDGGFYYAADVLPNCPYFCYFNINAPEMWEMQYQYIRERKVNYIVTRYYRLEQYLQTSDYELVDTAEFSFEGINFPYYLYRLKGETQ